LLSAENDVIGSDFHRKYFPDETILKNYIFQVDSNILDDAELEWIMQKKLAGTRGPRKCWGLKMKKTAKFL
jgi:hypothetical protein